MGKHLVRPLSKLASTFINGVPRQCFLSSLSLKTLFHLEYPHPNFKPKYVFFSTSIPPYEQIEPFTDISDVICNPIRIFKPQFGSLIFDIRNGAPLMEMNLTDYCNKFLIRLTPNFVAFVLSSTQVNINPDIAFRFFNWAGKQKKYNHKLECYVSLIDVLSVYYDVGRIKVVSDKFKG